MDDHTDSVVLRDGRVGQNSAYRLTHHRLDTKNRLSLVRHFISLETVRTKILPISRTVPNYAPGEGRPLRNNFRKNSQ
jgi:hypothetical protein